MLTLINAHALLHKATRNRDPGGRIQATLDDYAAVHELIGALISHGIALSVPAKARVTLEGARRALTGKGGNELTLKELAIALQVIESNARRRAYECFSLGLASQPQPARKANARHARRAAPR